jgi:hypothetical protein
MLLDHPLFCGPIAQVVGDEFRAIIAAQDRGTPLVLNAVFSTADGQGAMGKFVSERQDFQGRPLASLVEDEIVGPDVVRVFDLQRKMLSCTYFSAQPPGSEREANTLPDLVNRLVTIIASRTKAPWTRRHRDLSRERQRSVGVPAD